MILLMIIVALILLGLCFGSFVNAFVWRLHEQEELQDQLDELKSKKLSKLNDQKISKLQNKLRERSISTGRSMCTDCNHTLAWYDLLPVISWLSVLGKCRYCHKPISWQYPVVELITAVLFVISYVFWPQEFNALGIFNFSIWLTALTAFMVLAVYDFRWMILPNKVVYPLIALAATQRLVDTFIFSDSFQALIGAGIAAIIGGGIFYILYLLSDGNWIGGGDVKLGYALGFFVGDPFQALLLLVLASFIGLIGALPTVFSGRFKLNLQIPFGPCLLLACIILVLTGDTIVGWYMNLLIS